MRTNPMRKKLIISLSIVLLSSGLTVSVLSFYPLSSGEPPFSSNQQVNSGSDANRVEPDLVVDSSDIVYCAWGDWRNGDWDVYFTKSEDHGITWNSPDVKVNTGSGNQSYPSIAVDSNGNLYAVWDDDRNGDWDIYFANSSDGGQTWLSPNVRINTDTTGTPNESQRVPQIAIDSEGTIYIVWHDDRNNDYDIYFSRSDDGGVTWLADNVRVNRDPAPSPNQMNPTMAVDSDGNIYVAWEEDAGTNADIIFSKSTNGGESWSDPHILVNSDGLDEDQSRPSIGVDFEGNIYLAWADRRNGNNYDIYSAASLDGGNTWTGPNVKVDNSTTGIQSKPDLVVGDTGTVYVVWQDSRNVHNDIYFAYSINKGQSWLRPDINVIEETTGMTQLAPAIAVGPKGPVHVVWRDNRNDPNDIYSAYIDPVHPFPFADQLKVEGFSEGTPEIQHIISHNPELSFRYTDPNSIPLEHYNVSIWNSDATSLLWFCNMTDSVSSQSEKTVKYNTAPCPVNGPQLVDGISYIFRVAVSNQTGYWSPESEISFHMNEVLLPQIPISPSDNSFLSASENQSVSWSSPGNDVEGDSAVSYNWEVATDLEFSNVIESGSGLVLMSGSFDTRPSGTFYWRVNLNDGWETGSFGNQPDGYWDFTTYTGDGPNNPPTITNKNEAPTSANVNKSISFEFKATDPDNDILAWSKVMGASWLKIGSENGTIYGAPPPDSLGGNSFTIQVTDGRGGLDNHTFTISVSSDTNGNGDGDDSDDGDSATYICLVLLIIIVIIIILLLLFIIYKKRKEDEEEDKDKSEEIEKGEIENIEGGEDIELGEEEQGKEQELVDKIEEGNFEDNGEGNIDKID